MQEFWATKVFPFLKQRASQGLTVVKKNLPTVGDGGQKLWKFADVLNGWSLMASMMSPEVICTLVIEPKSLLRFSSDQEVRLPPKGPWSSSTKKADKQGFSMSNYRVSHIIKVDKVIWL